MFQRILILTILIFALTGCTLTDFLALYEPEPSIYDYSLTTFDGKTIHFADYEGQILVINFWASWAAPCRAEAPEMQAAWEHYKAQGTDVVFIGIAYADNGPKSMEFIEEFGITYLNGPDLGTVLSEAFGITGVPETYIIDRNGDIASLIIAPITQDELIETISAIQAE